MAYAAVISLKQTINGHLNSCRVSRRREILEFAYSQTTSLQGVLEIYSGDWRRSSSERVDDLDWQIRDCAHQLEDFLEFDELNEGELEEFRKEIVSFVFKVLEMQADYIPELSKPGDETETETADSSNIDFGVEMVGRSTAFTDFRKFLLSKMRPDDMLLLSFLGECGSGKTLVANTIFQDLRKCKRQYFDCFAWVTVGTNYELKEVLIRILAQVDNLAAGEYGLMHEDDKIRSYLNKVLESRRYMIVLDDVRDVQLLDYLRSSFPNRSNGSVAIVTTSFKEVALLADIVRDFALPRCYFEGSFWFILRGVIFGVDDPISPELEQAGKKIVENCRALSLLAAKTLLFLCSTENLLENWTKLAGDEANPIFMIEDEISEICTLKIWIQSYNWDTNNTMENLVVKMISNYVDHSDAIAQVKKLMHPEWYFSKMQIIPLLGMAGIGKSFFAKKIFDDKSILCYFDHRVWVTLGPKYQSEEILIDILAQIYPRLDKRQMKGDEKFARDLCLQLSGKRCLIVLDDLWSKEPLHHLRVLFPDIKGTTLVTTRLAKLAKFEGVDYAYQMKLLDEEESWCLLCKKVFAEGLCPPELERVGRQIAENCDGLPLLILTVAEELLKVEISQEYWTNVASGKQKSIFMNAHHKISKGLLPSYQSLPEHLKPCFLYIGVFRIKYEISISKLTTLLIVEGFLESNPPFNEYFIEECLCELAGRSLVMLHPIDLAKTCRLHSVFWHLSNSLAEKNKFYHAMNSYDDCTEESLTSQRRLCIRNNILLGIRDVQNSIMSSCTSTHSFLCVGPPHQYAVPISFHLRLLRVMDALTIRLYEFPAEVVELFHLGYLALTCNGDLPTSISNLWKLRYLIVSRYMSTNSSKSYNSLLPVEIWDMKELEHLQIMGGCLPNPKCSDDGLPKLSTLLDVRAQTCRLEVLTKIPNLKRLGIRIEFSPNDDGDSFYYLNNINHLCGLESLKCVVVNPQIISKVVPLPAPSSMFPSSLKKLSLSGFGYPWEHMSIIGRLKNLEVLKLKRYAFQGPQWDMDHNSQFNKLKFLIIEDTNLERWTIQSAISTDIQWISIKHCYKLQELPIVLPMYQFRKIEIVDCNPSTVSWAEQMREMVPFNCDVQVHLSWNDSKLHS